ncbi:S-adenosyl-L-methionine-dependent methyltransferase [Nemania sp. FL0916]|nr:S-adenosyl-L-methionine-dependent methyltransferase [Nemania sp. FL0916]
MADIYAETMPRHKDEVERINQQFDLVAKNMGYILHPSIELSSSPRIADIGTGTARFIFRLYSKIPDAIWEGFDISSALFPDEDTLPPNVSLSVLDIKQPFPEHMHEKYDLVQARLLTAAMQPGDWEPTIRNIFRILKPGGYLQWTEPEIPNIEWLKTTPNSKVQASKYIGDKFFNSYADTTFGWNALPAQMQAAGYSSVIRDVKKSDTIPETRRDMTHIIANLCLSWVRMKTERGASEPPFGDCLDSLEKEVDQEIESGCYVRFNIHDVCGQKPLM